MHPHTCTNTYTHTHTHTQYTVHNLKLNFSKGVIYIMLDKYGDSSLILIAVQSAVFCTNESKSSLQLSVCTDSSPAGRGTKRRQNVLPDCSNTGKECGS